MRNEVIQSVVEVVYPDLLTHINDRNCITVNSLNAKPVGGRLTFTCNGNSVTVEYDSELPNLVFRINSSLKKIANGQHQTVSVTGYASNDGISYQITPFTLVVEQGRSLNSRPHGCCRTMYYQNDSDLEKVEIYVPVTGTATVGQYVYTLQAGVNKLDLTEYNQTPVTPPSGDFPITIHLNYSHSDNPVFFGDLWNHASESILDQTDYTISMRQITAGNDCSTDNSVSYGKIKFLDTDGAHKTFLGKLTNMRYTMKQSEYINNDLVVNNPMSFITEHTQEMTLVFGDVRHDAYIHDIMYSPHIMYLNGYGEWKDCLLADSNLDEKNGEEDDVTIKLKVLA